MEQTEEGQVAGQTEFDVFQWANSVDEVKNNISVELFLFNKNYTPYKVRYSDVLMQTIRSMFMLEAVEFVIKEADKGLECREYELSDGEDKVIYRIDLEKVGRAETLIHLIENEYKDIAFFTDNEYEFKRIKGIVAKFTYPGDEGQKTFYIAKGLAASSALKGKLSWELNGESFEPLTADVAIKVPEGNETAIVDGNIVIFNQSKFEKLFQYDYKQQVISEQKAKELQDAYSLSFPEGLTLNALLEDKKPLVKKLQAVEIGEMKQDQLLDYADEMQLELMTDDDGKIIIMDDKDLNMFVNLLSEDYFVSPVNGRRYEIKSKKLLDEPEGEPPRG
ncbi:MAG: DUF4868 domain-containing protein [Candidatus Saccharibacteria bacterium]|nr:DUF4868 domain-containing protein [Candidatus Saccharibacteria bacterium]